MAALAVIARASAGLFRILVKWRRPAGVVVSGRSPMQARGFRFVETSKSPAYCTGCPVIDPYVASKTLLTRLA